MKLREWAASECQRQGSTKVQELIEAFRWFAENSSPETLEQNILTIAALIEPEKNSNGYRTVPVTFDSGGTALDAELIPRAMELLCTNYRVLSPNDFCKQFLDIHPFLDGNGRVASTLWNLLQPSSFGYWICPEPLPYFYGGE